MKKFMVAFLILFIIILTCANQGTKNKKNTEIGKFEIKETKDFIVHNKFFDRNSVIIDNYTYRNEVILSKGADYLIYNLETRKTLPKPYPDSKLGVLLNYWKNEKRPYKNIDTVNFIMLDDGVAITIPEINPNKVFSICNMNDLSCKEYRGANYHTYRNYSISRLDKYRILFYGYVYQEGEQAEILDLRTNKMTKSSVPDYLDFYSDNKFFSIHRIGEQAKKNFNLRSRYLYKFTLYEYKDGKFIEVKSFIPNVIDDGLLEFFVMDDGRIVATGSNFVPIFHIQEDQNAYLIDVENNSAKKIAKFNFKLKGHDPIRINEKQWALVAPPDIATQYTLFTIKGGNK